MKLLAEGALRVKGIKNHLCGGGWGVCVCVFMYVCVSVCVCFHVRVWGVCICGWVCGGVWVCVDGWGCGCVHWGKRKGDTSFLYEMRMKENSEVRLLRALEGTVRDLVKQNDMIRFKLWNYYSATYIFKGNIDRINKNCSPPFSSETKILKRLEF